MITTDWISAKPYIVGEGFFCTLNNAIIQYIKKIKKNDINISTNIVTDNVMRKLNKSWRDINKTTDVLSFPYNEDKKLASGDYQQNYAGEVIISIDQAKRQSKDNKHSLRAEIALLYIHGVLHILGYDHGNVSEHKRMYTLQDQIFINWKKSYGQKNIK